MTKVLFCPINGNECTTRCKWNDFHRECALIKHLDDIADCLIQIATNGIETQAEIEGSVTVATD